MANQKIIKESKTIKPAAIAKGVGRGGARPGAGRKKDSATAKTREVANRVMAAAPEGGTPLEVMMAVMKKFWDEAETHLKKKDDEESQKVGIKLLSMAKDAASSAAPYVHPRLAAIEHTGRDGKDLLPSSGVLVVPGTMSMEEWAASAKEDEDE